MFKDQSIFEGILEFNSPVGTIRAEKNSGTVKIYLHSGNAFIYDATIQLHRNTKFTCKNVYKAYEISTANQ